MPSTTVLGKQASLNSDSPALSANGKLLVFESAAPNLVADDTNRASDIFLRNVETGALTRIPGGTGVEEANGSSDRPILSADGRFIVFRSSASNLVDDDNNQRPDLFLYDIQAGSTKRISVDSSGNETYGYGYYTTAISQNGRFVAFASDAADLVSGDTNGVDDVFLHDTQTGQTTRVSVASNGTEANAYSDAPTLSADGRYVAFTSNASNLVNGDTEGKMDVFVHDTQTHSTIRVSVDGSGHGGNDRSGSPTLSSDGRYVAFDSLASNLVPNDNNAASDIFLRDLLNNVTSLISKDGSGHSILGNSFDPSISADGKFITFESSATLIVADSNNKRDIYLYDVVNNINTLVSIDSNASQANEESRSAFLSADGKHTAFVSLADNLDLLVPDTNVMNDIFVRDRVDVAKTTRQSLATDGPFPAPPNGPCCYDIRISSNGSYVVYDSQAGNLVVGDTNTDLETYYKGIQDIFVYDTNTQSTIRASVHSDGTQSSRRSDHGSISADGRYVVFDSLASDLIDDDTNYTTDVFLHDMQSHQTRRISLDPLGNQLDASSSTADISANGRFVVFISGADNLVTGDTNGVEDVFVLDRQTGDYQRVNVSSQGVQVTDTSNFTFAPRISGDGRYVVFQSSADNLVADDTNGVTDVFVHDLQQEKTWRVSINSSGEQGDAQSGNPVISDDGRYITYASSASNLAPKGDNNGAVDVFLYDMQNKTTSLISQDSNGNIGNDHSNSPSITPDGGYVSFSSSASNLVSDDGNNRSDIFIRDVQAGTTVRASINDAGTGGDDDSSTPAISSVDGKALVAFRSNAKNLTPGIGSMPEVFVHQTGSCSSYSVLPTTIPSNYERHWQCDHLEAVSGFVIQLLGYGLFEADAIVLGPGFRVEDGGVFRAMLLKH
jgi:Tol biopolymer transport system component